MKKKQEVVKVTPKKIQKTPDTNTSEKEVAKKAPWEDYLNTVSLQMQPANKNTKERLATKLVEWVKMNEKASFEDQNYRMEDFYDAEGIAAKTCLRWRKDCPLLEEAHQYAKSRLASLREKGGLQGRLNVPLILKTQPIYDAEFAALEEKRLNQDKSSATVQTVMIPIFPKGYKGEE